MTKNIAEKKKKKSDQIYLNCIPIRLLPSEVSITLLLENTGSGLLVYTGKVLFAVAYYFAGYFCSHHQQIHEDCNTLVVSAVSFLQLIFIKHSASQCLLVYIQYTYHLFNIVCCLYTCFSERPPHHQRRQDSQWWPVFLRRHLHWGWVHQVSKVKGSWDHRLMSHV